MCNFIVPYIAIQRISFYLNLIQIFATIQKKLTLLHRYKTSDRQQFIEQHRLLLDALRQQDTNLVQKRLDEHFTEARQWARQLQESSRTEGGKP